MMSSPPNNKKHEPATKIYTALTRAIITQGPWESIVTSDSPVGNRLPQYTGVPRSESAVDLALKKGHILAGLSAPRKPGTVSLQPMGAQIVPNPAAIYTSRVLCGTLGRCVFIFSICYLSEQKRKTYIVYDLCFGGSSSFAHKSASRFA